MTFDASTGAGVVALLGLLAKIYFDWRADRDRARQVNAEIDRSGDESIVRLFTSLNQSESEFRKSVYEALLAERNENRQLSERLTTVTNQLSIITLERDSARHELDKAREQVNVLQHEVNQLRDEVARLRRQMHDRQPA